VVSEESDELFVVDLQSMTEVGRVDTRVGEGINQNHMALVSEDGLKVYVMATAKDSVVVVNALTLEVEKTIPVGSHTTHANACWGCGPGGRDELWVVNEGGSHEAEESGDHAEASEDAHGSEGSLSVIDMGTDEVVQTIEDASFMVPHFVRFAGRRAYVPSIGGNQISVVDLDSYVVSDVLLLEGTEAPSECSGDPCGFADAQIDGSGRLFAAHIETGRVVVYDTVARERFADVAGGAQPWSVFVDSFDASARTHLMPNWGDSTVSIFDRAERREIARSADGDRESYGDNYSPLAPDQASVLNRVKGQVAVTDRETGERDELLDVGGTTETGSTTADGRFLLLPISSQNEFRVLDAVTRNEVAVFDNVGQYPWSVTTVGGQNYCH
jgi:YVTN family beta-propeller protein